MSGDIETQQSVFDGHFMEGGSFLIAEERVRYPDFSPAVVAKSKRRAVVVRSEDKSRVPPRLTQVHADRVVLQVSHCPVTTLTVHGQLTSGTTSAECD